jgi:prepilin-type N-terminal cleavage/methylation domain-containing protein
MKRRRGFTLIEMVAVVTIGTVLMGIAVLLLHSLLKSHDSGREHINYYRTLNRLAEQFRSDAHATEKTSSADDGKTFDFLPNAADSAKIRYQLLPGRIDRTELKGEKAVRQDSYKLLPDMQAAINIQTDKDTEIASILISPNQDQTKLYHPLPVRIDAVLGRDLKSSKVQPATEDKP